MRASPDDTGAKNMMRRKEMHLQLYDMILSGCPLHAAESCGKQEVSVSAVAAISLIFSAEQATSHFVPLKHYSRMQM